MDEEIFNGIVESVKEAIQMSAEVKQFKTVPPILTKMKIELYVTEEDYKTDKELLEILDAYPYAVTRLEASQV